MTPHSTPAPRTALRRVVGGWQVGPVIGALAVMALLAALYMTMFNTTFLYLPIDYQRILVATGISVVAVGWCRRWPVPVALVVVACFGVSFLSGGPAVVAAVVVALRRRPWEVVGVGVLWVTVAIRLVLRAFGRYGADRQSGWPFLVSMLTLLVVISYGVCVAVGWYIGSRSARIADLQARAEAIEREQAEHVAKAQTAERTRIAREMHDVLAHRISLVAIHSGALAYRTDLTPKQVRTAATTVQESARLALAELREVLGVLRDTSVEPGAPDRPQPTLATLDALLAETREAGTSVALSVDAPTADLLPTLGASTSRHAYRILQEALTNARKHAPGAAVEVTITGTPGDRLELVVHNTSVSSADPAGDATTPGLGLVGLAERAALAGGALVAGEEPADDAARFTVRAWLPWAT